MWYWFLIVFILFIIFLRTRKRGYFWKDKAGNKLTFKEFLGRWGKGIEGITPLQQTRTVLIAFLPVLAGISWGIVVSIIGKIYWMTLILCGSLPITLVQVVNNIQKYRAQKRVEQALKDLERRESNGKIKKRTRKRTY